MSTRLIVVLSLVAPLCTLCAVGQTPPAATQPSAGQPPAAQPTTSQPGDMPTPQDVLAATERWLEAARQAKARGDTANATALLKQIGNAVDALLNFDPKNVPAKLVAGEAAMLADNPNEARVKFKEVLDLEPANFRANLGLGRFYAMSRMWRQGVKFLQDAEKVAPPDRRGEVLRLQALCLDGQRRSAEAVAVAQRAVEASPQDQEAVQLLIRIRVQAQQFDRALEGAKSYVAATAQARSGQPSDPAALQSLYHALETEQDVLKLYHNSLHKKDARGAPMDDVLPGKEIEVAQLLIQIVECGEDMSKLHTEMEYHESLMLIRRATELQPKNTRYMLALAALQEATHQTEKAIETYQHILLIADPTDPDPAAARQNKDSAEAALRQLNAPLTTQPAATTAPAAP
jgi:tetratricopeptide (TPR) repeat protein